MLLRRQLARPLPSARVSLTEKIFAIRTSQLVRAILSFVDSYGLPRDRWNAGISGNPYQRLSRGHGIRPGDAFGVWHAGSETLARRVERALFGFGLKGSWGGLGEVLPEFVYVFLEQKHTR